MKRKILTLPVSDGTQTSTLPLRIANQLAPRSPVRNTIIRREKRQVNRYLNKEFCFHDDLRVTPLSKFSK